jgi:hypothetical protein
VMPACLPTRMYPPATDLFISGWGQVRGNQLFSTKTLITYFTHMKLKISLRCKSNSFKARCVHTFLAWERRFYLR